MMGRLIRGGMVLDMPLITGLFTLLGGVVPGI